MTIDVSQFAPEDLKVTVNEGMLIIEGKHPMIKDQFGEVCGCHFLSEKTKFPTPSKLLYVAR